MLVTSYNFHIEERIIVGSIRREKIIKMDSYTIKTFPKLHYFSKSIPLQLSNVILIYNKSNFPRVDCERVESRRNDVKSLKCASGEIA